jgi:hypothetical protein
VSARETDAVDERPLGVVEAFTVTRDQCPKEAVRRVASEGLETVRREGAGALPVQAFYLLTAARGWHGQQAARVKRALEAFLAEHERSGAES